MKSKKIVTYAKIFNSDENEFNTDENDKNESNTNGNDKNEFNTVENDKNEFNAHEDVKKYQKVKDHCPYRGKFRGAADSICNLRYKKNKLL